MKSRTTSVPHATFDRARRTFLMNSCVSAVALSSLTTGALAAATLNVAQLQARSHPIAKGMQAAAEQLATRTSERLTLNLVGESRIATGGSAFKEVAGGQLDGLVYIAGTVVDALDAPRSLTLFDAPFIARDWRQMRRIASSDWAHAQFDRLAAERGIVQVGLPWNYGTRHVTTGGRALKRLADFEGLRLRVPNNLPLYEEMFTALGARPIVVPFPELYAKLKSGEVQGQENPLPTIAAARFYEVQRHLCLTGHTVNPYFVFFNAARWAALTEADRAAVTAALNAGSELSDGLFAADEAGQLSNLREKGMEVSQIDRAELLAAVKPLHARLASDWGLDTLRRLQAL